MHTTVIHLSDPPPTCYADRLSTGAIAVTAGALTVYGTLDQIVANCDGIKRAAIDTAVTPIVGPLVGWTADAAVLLQVVPNPVDDVDPATETPVPRWGSFAAARRTPRYGGRSVTTSDELAQAAEELREWALKQVETPIGVDHYPYQTGWGRNAALRLVRALEQAEQIPETICPGSGRYALIDPVGLPHCDACDAVYTDVDARGAIPPHERGAPASSPPEGPPDAA